MSRLFAIFFVLLAACSGRGRPLQVNLISEALELDWNKAVDTNSVLVIDNLMEGLTSYADSLSPGGRLEQLRPMPALAKSWSLSSGGTRYVFHLRPNVFWSDGVPLKAQQFVDSWRRLLNPETHSENSYHLFDVEGAQEYAAGKIDFSSVGIRAPDDLTLEVKLKRPVPYFLHLVAAVNTFPVRMDLIEKHGGSWTDPSHLVTLGPYRLRAWVHGERVELEANSRYWGEEPPIRHVIGRIISEPLVALALYKNGELDILPRDLPSGFLPQLEKEEGYRVGPKLSVSYIAFNTRKAPFDRAAMRRAFLESVDREKLAKLFHGEQKPLSSWIPPGMLAYNEDIGLRLQEKAPESLRGKTAIMKFSGSDTWNLVFETLQRSMKDSLGLNLKLDATDPREYSKYIAQLSALRRGKSKNAPNLFHLGWVADYPDPQSFMNVFTSTSESNYTGWTNKDYDALVRRAASSDNEAERVALYNEAQKILLEEEAVLLPLFSTSHQALVRPELKGVVLNPLDKWYFKNLRFGGKGE